MVFAWRKVVALQLRHLERVALGTPYPEVVDLLQKARPACKVMPVNITSGLKQTSEGGYYGVPKRDLIVGLQVMLQRGALKIAAGMKYGPELVREMAAMQVKITLSGTEQHGAWREGTHDDLVLAVALACWNVQNLHPEDVEAKEQWSTNRLMRRG